MTIRPLLVCSATRGFAAGAADALFAGVAGCALFFGAAGASRGPGVPAGRPEGLCSRSLEDSPLAMKTATDGSTGPSLDRAGGHRPRRRRVEPHGARQDPAGAARTRWPDEPAGAGGATAGGGLRRGGGGGRRPRPAPRAAVAGGRRRPRPCGGDPRRGGGLSRTAPAGARLRSPAGAGRAPRRSWREPAAADWAVPRWRGNLEPLCALYGPAALAALGRRVERGLLALHRLAEEALAVRVLEGGELTALRRSRKRSS